MTNKLQALIALHSSYQLTRHSFTADELTRVFYQPLFIGCKSEHHIHVPGNTLIRHHRFWLPPLALHSGGRLKELTQAAVRDVEDRGGAIYMFIRTEADEDED